MKKIISLVLAVCLIVTTLCSVTMTASAATTVRDITVDLTKSERVGSDETNLTMSATYGDDGSMNVTFSNYAKLFMNGTAVNKTEKLWLGGSMYALKDSSDNFIILQKNVPYSINVIYDVTSVGTTNATYVPQVGLGYNNHATNTTQDNGTFMLGANKHTATGSYSLSVQTTPKANQPLRLHFGGHGAVTVKAITIKAVSQSVTASDTSKTVNLTLSDDISVSGAQYFDFSPATATEPLKITVAGTKENQFMDGNNSWANNWHTTAHWVKTGLVSLNYDESSHPVLDDSKAYQVVVKYKVTETSATTVGLYPEIAIVRNNNKSTTGDNGTFTLGATRIDPSKAGQELTFTTGIFNKTGMNGYPLRLAFAGVGSFEVYSVVIKEIPHYAKVTFVNDGISTADYAVYGSELPTPVKAGYTFMGWFDADGVKHTTVTGAKTITAAWLKNTNVDLTKAAKIEGTKATMTLDIPTDAASALGVTIMGFNGILMDKESGEVHTGKVYTAGAAVALKYSDDSYVGLKNTSKYLVNVNYDVTSIDTLNKVYHPQIALLYNSATTTEDNGQYILSAKKHSKTVDNASISCVINGVDAKALRLAFDGQGTFSIKSVTVTEIPADNTSLKLVTYTDDVYSTSKVVVAENGTAIADLARTDSHNFDGWYSGEEKVTAVSGDTAITAKWFSKFDLTKDNATNLLDLIRIKKALADNSSDIFYDIDRDDKVDATDATSLKKNILGIKDVILDEEEAAGFTVVSGDQKSF